MSGNQKQTAAVGPQQTQRYPAQFLPRPPTPQRGESFHVSTPQTYVPQQPPAQPGNQGQLRTIPSAVPPNQPSTPPNNDIKVQQMPQQASIGIAYVQQPTQLRGGPNFYNRSQVPNNQTQRMTNHRQGQQAALYQQGTYVQMTPVPSMYITPQYTFNGGARPQAFPSQSFPMQISPYSTYPHGTQPQSSYYYSPLTLPRPGPGPAPPPLATGPQNTTQPPPPIPLNQNSQQHSANRPQKRRIHAIPIIDPSTGNEVVEDSSHPASGESSARQTPQPAAPSTNKEVQAAFAKQVAQAINSDETIVMEPHNSPVDNVDHSIYQHSSQAVNNRFENIVQSSKLQVQTKEFIPANLTVDKETPVVSALTDAVEVTIANKQPKDRESPVKTRKHKELPPKEQQQHKETPKEPKETAAEKQQPAIKEEVKHKEAIVATPAVVSAEPASNKDSKELSNLNQREERKNQRKEKVETKVVPVAVVQEAPEVPALAADFPALQENTAVSGKSKQNAAQRNKDGGKQSSQQQQPTQQSQVNQKQQAPAPVPPSQPAKPNSKTSKIKEINMKGTWKEGTDMDAFNDNAPAVEEPNANVTNSITPSMNDNSNVNPVPINTNIPSGVSDSNKRTESNEVVTIKPEVKVAPKSKVDVTAIVKDVPKTLKTFVGADSQDETDRAATLSNEKLVQVKNEVNAKSNTESNESSNIMEHRQSLSYKEDQWAPFNLEGKKKYDRDFLLALKNDPLSKRKPESIPLDVFKAVCRQPNMSGRADFAPQFGNMMYMGGGKSSSQHGVPKRNSQQGKIGGSGNKGNKPAVRVSISVREDVKLRESDNAWKPVRFNPVVAATEEEQKTEELYKRVRGVLNKLTPEKFDTLVKQVRTFPIDNIARLQGVMDLVFEKAVDEPNFAVGYALMCRELALINVPVTNSDGTIKDPPETVNFRKLLITRCQSEFEKSSVDETVRQQKLKEIEECTDPQEKKKDMMAEMEEYERRIRMKSVGNTRFIGELYKQNMLTVNIMVRCLMALLENKDEERLECLCKLLTTIGKELESKNVNLSAFFQTMQEIVDKKHGKISSRIRFMLQDVIDLRKSDWVPRRQDSNPKTIDQIKKEAETEHLNIQVMNSMPMTPRKDDRSGMGKRRNVSDDGWSPVPSRNRAGGNTSFTIKSDKLKNRVPQLDEPLGSSLMFGAWCRGSNIKTSVPPNIGNMYSHLENAPDMDKRTTTMRGSNSKEPYSSKGPSLERDFNKQYNDGRNSRSGSQHRMNDNSEASQHRAAPVVAPAAVLKSAEVAAEDPKISASQVIDRKMKTIIEEYLADCSKVDDSCEDFRDTIPQSAFPTVISDGYLMVLERSKTARLRAGLLFATLIKKKIVPLEDYCTGLQDILSQVDDLTIDIPKIWDYIAELLVHPLCEETISIKVLHKCCNVIISQNHAAKLLAPLFKLIAEEKGPNFLRNIWLSSSLSPADFIPQADVDQFISKNNLEYLLASGDISQSDLTYNRMHEKSQQKELTYDQIHDKLLQLYNSQTSFDEISGWIDANVGERIKDKKFSRTLATTIFENSIVKNKLNVEALQRHHKLFQKYVDNDPELELQCLYALQALIIKLESPQGLLLAFCDALYQGGIFAQDSFISWESSTDPAEQEGKGVAVKQLTSFFTQLKEVEEETASSASDET